LAHHGLTTQVPHNIDIALPSHSQVPRVDNIPVRVFWFSKPTYNAGIERLRIDDVPIRIYSPEKTIADCFKYRNKIGVDIAIEGLRAYREKYRRPDRAALIHYAQICRVERVMRPYLQAIL
jgi:predicted transcriptional regulator of viral defense system